MSRVTCQVSHVTCPGIFIFYKVLKLIGGVSVINGDYPVLLFDELCHIEEFHILNSHFVIL